MLRHSVVVLALCGCASKKDAPKQQPTAVVVDAAPTPGLHVVAVDAAVALPMRARMVVVLAADGALTYVATPQAGDEVALASLAAGTPVELSALAATVKLDRLVDNPCMAGILGNMQQADGYAGFAAPSDGVNWQDLSGATTPAGLRGQVLASYCDIGAPLIVADERATAARLIEVLDALDRATLAVTTDGGEHARMLALELTYRKGNTPANDAAIELGFTLRPDGARGAAYRGRIADEQAWMWRGDVTNLADGYHQGAATTTLLGANLARLRIDGDVTAGALITALASLVAGHAVTVAIGEPIDYVDLGHGAGTATGGKAYGHATVVPQVTLGQAKITGGFDKAILRRYLKRNMLKINYCYEKELLARPDLAGTVTATFTIDPSGAITDISAKGVSTEVADCVANVIGFIFLPKPPDGEPNQVTVPIEMKATPK